MPYTSIKFYTCFRQKKDNKAINLKICNYINLFQKFAMPNQLQSNVYYKSFNNRPFYSFIIIIISLNMMLSSFYIHFYYED